MKKLIMSVLAMAALASCEQATENVLPEPTPENNLVPIELRAKVLGMEAVTKATISAFDGTQNIGIYALKEGETPSSYAWSATPYYHNTDAVTIDDKGVISFTTPVYYPINDKKVKFFAYYPKEAATADFIKPTGDAIPAKVKYTITGQEDIMLATAESKALKDKTDSEVVNLTFYHKLAKINFKLIKGDGFPENQKVTTIKLTGCHNVLTMDLSDGSFSPEATTVELTALENGSEAINATSSTTVGEIMIKPGATYGLSVTVDGVTDPFTATNLTAPQAGQQQTVTLTFKGTAISTKATIGPWTNASAGSADLQK